MRDVLRRGLTAARGHQPFGSAGGDGHRAALDPDGRTDIEALPKSLGDATVRLAALDTLDPIGWRAESDTGAAIVAI